MDIKNKKVIIIGDSITNGTGASSTENRYTDVFARITGSTVYNYGVGGTRIARQRKAAFPPNEAFAERDYNMRLDEDVKETEADLIVVFGGTNDFGHGDAPLGSFSDNDEYTFYGAMHVLIKKLLNRYPEARLIFMTPLHRSSENEYLNSQGIRRALLIDYVKAIREVCEYYSIPVLDLYKDSGIQPSVPVIKETFMPDGLHPSDKGMYRIANMLAEFVKQL